MNRNRGFEAEELTIKAGFTINTKRNAKGSEAPDAVDARGRGHQLKADRATIANNFGRELGNDIIKEIAQLIADDYSDLITLVATWKGRITLYSFRPDHFNQMVNEYPEIAYYDRASKKNGGGTTIRLKVKSKYRVAYEKHHTEKLEI